MFTAIKITCIALLKILWEYVATQLENPYKNLKLNVILQANFRNNSAGRIRLEGHILKMVA